MRASGGTPEGFLSSSRNVRAVQTLARGVNDHPRLTKAFTDSGRRFGPFGRVPVAVVVALALLVSGTASVRSVTPASVDRKSTRLNSSHVRISPGTTVR